MKLASAAKLLLLVFLFSTVSGVAADGYKAEAIGAAPSADVPETVTGILEAQGTRLVGSQGPICEVWLRKNLTLGQAEGGMADILYGQLAKGSVVGLIHLPNQGADFRGQTLKPGYYLLRYALVPQDGAHVGVYPYRDALVLSPPSADTDVEKNLEFADMVKLGCMVSGTPHPAFLVMAPVDDGQALPSVGKDESGFRSLQLEAHGQNGNLPIGITLVGKWEGM